MSKSSSEPNDTNQNQSSSAEDILSGQAKPNRLKRLLPFLGPAFIASVAYIDPGNFATNIQAGSAFGYTLLWVIVMSNVMAMLLQTLSAKLGIATGYNLAELCRMYFPKWLVWFMWGAMELVAIATDLAEFLGAAIGLNLLFGMPLWIAGILTAIVTFIILELERFGFRPIEAVITGLVGIVAFSYVIETILDQPEWSQVLNSALIPRFNGTESILLATGIVGATVMPHAIYLHSALTQKRVKTNSDAERKRLFQFELIDILIAMGLAGMINAAMLIMAAATFFNQGMVGIASIEEAHRTLEPLLGQASSTVFAISLLTAGLASTTVGTMSGQVIMQGFLHRHIPVWVRRAVTMIPSLIVIFMGIDPTRTLVISQVVLSFGLPFAIVPLIYFTVRRDIMGNLVNSRIMSTLAIISALIIVALNAYLLYQTFFPSA